MATLKVPVTSADHIEGEDTAQITLVEYGDYQCPYCGEAYPIIKQIQKHFGNKLRFVFRNFPLTEMHPYAEAAAEVAEFANTHQKFWLMHDALYENQDRLGGPLFLELATKLQLPIPELETAVNAGTFKEKIKSDFIGGVRSGVNGTPALYINGKRHDGSFAFEDLKEAITLELSQEKASH